MIQRDISGLDPTWEQERPAPRVLRAASWAGGRVFAVLRRVHPHWGRWVQGMDPELSFAWGGRRWTLREGRISSTARDGEGYGDNPRKNYNDVLERRAKRRERSAGGS